MSVGFIGYNYGEYRGTFNDIKKDFALKHKNDPIFKRYIDASNPSVVFINKDTIRIPNHFFVTGEEIVYSPYGGTKNSIGIATTSIPGIGLTDKLPSTLYAVKVNDIEIKVASSASNALKTIPKILDLTSVGIGSLHSFTSKNQNKKIVLTIDNVIQSPIVSTSTTTILASNLDFYNPDIFVSSIDGLNSGDLIIIDDEIMKITSVGVGSTNSISVERSWMGSISGFHTSPNLVTKIVGNYNVFENTVYFDGPPYGKVPILNSSNRPDELDYVGLITGSSFSGRVFLRSGVLDTSDGPYDKNYTIDDISDQFDAKENIFTLKTNKTDVTGISTDNLILLINNVFQSPNFVDYSLSENSGITSVSFTGSGTSVPYDPNYSNIPRGGIILSVGSTSGFGYQPLISAGGTAVVSSAGTIQSISIGNSGSGYRVGIQTIVNVGVTTESFGESSIQFIGTATISGGHIVSVAVTNPGFGYTSTNPPIVIFDSPLSYSNIPLIYSSQSSLGIGTGAVINIVVGQGSSIIDYEITNFGYAYEENEILTIPVGGTVGIPTNSSFSEFQISIDKTYSDNFSAWSIGNLRVIDPIDFLFDGNRTIFPILIGGNQTSIRTKKGSNIDIQATLLVFINDILQVPGKGYVFSGGSTIKFTEAPKEGDTSKIIFYAGTYDIDTRDIDILETIKVGDEVTLKSDDANLTENDRLVTEIVSSDTLRTNLYPGPGLSNEDLLRPLTWCRQTDDVVVNGQYVAKNRIIYESYIQPSTNIIRNVGIASSAIFVESIRPFFDSEREYLHNDSKEKIQRKIVIVSQDSLLPAAATAVVSSAGTITSIILSDGGVGYTTSPNVSISPPRIKKASAISSIDSNGQLSTIEIVSPGYGYTVSPQVLIQSPSQIGGGIGITATATSYISSGIVTSIVITNVGLGYTFAPTISIESPGLGTTATASSLISGGVVQNITVENFGSNYTSIPNVLIESPVIKYEVIDKVFYEGDFGIITGIGTTSVGVASTGIVFDFFIPKNSVLRDNKTVKVGIATTGISGIQTGYYFVVKNSNIGFGITSLDSSGSVVGIGTSFIDNIYQVSSVSIAQTSVAGVGITNVAKVTVSVSGYNNLSGFGFSSFYGEYSWGRILAPTRPYAKEFISYSNNGGGISTSPIVQRYNRLKYIGYSTT